MGQRCNEAAAWGVGRSEFGRPPYLDLPNLLTLNAMKSPLFTFLGACLLLVLAPLSAQAQCAEGESEVVVEILTDNYPGEITWTLTVGGELLSGGPYNSTGTVYADTVCIASEEEFPPASS